MVKYFDKTAKIVFVAVAFSILSISYFLYTKSNIDVSSELKDGAVTETQKREALKVTFKKVDEKSKSSVDSFAEALEAHKKSSKILSVYGTAQEEAEVKKWCSAREAICSLEQDNEKIYEGYSIETLESLADEGDIRAMHHLADRYARLYIDKGEGDAGLKLKNTTLERAAVHGSTKALMQLGIAANSGSLQSKKEGRELLLEPLAYFEVAATRGDRLAKSKLSKHVITEGEIEITNEDIGYIETRAEEIYQDLQRKRHELGLGDFDNDIPESVKRYFDRIQ